MKIDQIHFYVENASRWRNWFISQMGFEAIAPSICHQNTLITGVKSGQATFLLYSPQTENTPVANYLKHHPPGIAAITFHLTQLREQLPNILAAGATLLQPLQTLTTEKGCLQWCQILGMTGLIHTLVEREGTTPLLPWLPHWEQKFDSTNQGLYFTGIDHLVLNVAAGELSSTVEWYERVFGWQKKQAFSIQTPHSGLHSQVLVSPDGKVQFPINEPTSDNSQVQEFINYNRGAGIQHIALTTPEITKVTLILKQKGLAFLNVPETYYTQLKERLSPLPFSSEEWQEIQQAQVLVDFEVPTLNDFSTSTPEKARVPLLLQIFTQPIFAEPTFFFELIERRDQAMGFGEGNFRALFTAIEQEQKLRSNSKP